MQISLSFISIIIIIAIILGLFISMLILSIKKENKLPNILLAVFLLAVVASISGAVLNVTKIYQYVPHLIKLNEPFRFLIGPLFYFYVIAMTTGKLKPDRWFAFHFLPFIANIVFLMPFYLKPADLKIRFVMNNCLTDQMPFLTSNFIYFILVSIQLAFYILLVKKGLKYYEKRSKDNFSSIEKINLSWLNYFVNIIIAFCVFMILIVILWPLRNHFIALIRPYPIFLSLLVIVLVFKALRQPAVLSDFPVNEKETVKKYELSTLESEDAEKYCKKLIQYMEKEKPYLEPELSLQQLADEVEIPVRHLSQVINEKMNMSFYNYVNSYRIQEVKQYLSDPEHEKENILNLAFNAGFNSKPTFNAVFKKATGLTPQQFRKDQLNNISNQ